MTALILNSGCGSRMGQETQTHPKCLTQLNGGETILSRQLRQLAAQNITSIVITTGPFADALEDYCKSLPLWDKLDISFVHNPRYSQTNYIYSMELARERLNGDLLLLHGDLVFEDGVLCQLLQSPHSAMVISTTVPLPEKDFKAVWSQGRIQAVGVEFFEHAVTAQPFYCLLEQDSQRWLQSIGDFCRQGREQCYAEAALNEVTDQVELYGLDIGDLLCSEIDTEEDWHRVERQLTERMQRRVFLSFGTDLLHSGHMAILQKAAELGKLTVGILSDEVIATYKYVPMVPFADRKAVMEQLSCVDQVIPQDTLSYAGIIRQLRPDIVVHGDDWRTGEQKPLRDEVCALLGEYGGQLVEYPYTRGEAIDEIESRARRERALPDQRRGRLRKLLGLKGLVTAMEAHSGLTGLIVEKTVVYENSQPHQFDAMWVSSLCDSTARGKPDMEVVDMTSRFRTLEEILEVTTKPIIFDGDTGGMTEHFVYTVRSLERMGVSMIIVEDKVGLKKNSLFGTEAKQTQDTIEHFCKKIAAGKHAQKSRDFMICARIESLILEQGQEDALARARAYVAAGADAIMIHSRRKDPQEIFEFVEAFRREDDRTPIVVVPTTFADVTEEEFRRRGVNVVIYANQLTRSAFPAMEETAKTILSHHRAREADDRCMPIKHILTLIPEEV